MNDHLTPQQMLGYLDGELSKPEMARTADHLHSCWSCRIEMERLEADIAVILDAHSESFAPSIPPPSRAWVPFSTLVIRDVGSERQPVWRQARSTFTAPLTPMRATLLAGVVCGVAMLLLFNLQSRTVSAKEVLANVHAAQERRALISPNHVLRERVHVRHTVKGHATRWGSISVWKSQRATVWETPTDDAAASALKEAYADHGIANDLPLSDSAVRVWTGVVGGQPAVSQREGLYELTFSPVAGTADNPVNLKLEVQATDWHIERMTVQLTDSSFELTEDNFASVPTSEIPPTLLAELEPGVQLNATAKQPVSDAEPDVIRLSPINLEHVQLNVLATLHRLHADLGEPITITHSNSRIEVGVWSLPADRQVEIRNSLENMTGVLIRTSPRTSQSLSRFSNPQTVEPPPTLPSSPVSIEDDRRLTNFFGDPGKEQSFTQNVLAESTDVLAHLYALRNLQAQFPPESEQALTPADQAQLLSIVHDHVEAVLGKLGELQRQLAPLNDAFGVPVLAAVEHEDPSTRWQDASLDALETARSADHQLRDLLTTSETPAAPDTVLPELQRRLAHLEAEMTVLQKQ